jgi:hypothetical protein
VIVGGGESPGRVALDDSDLRDRKVLVNGQLTRQGAARSRALGPPTLCMPKEGELR